MSGPAQFALPFLIEPTDANNQGQPVDKTPDQPAKNESSSVVTPDIAGKPLPAANPVEQSAKIRDESKQRRKRTVGATGTVMEMVRLDGKVLVGRKVAGHMLSISIRAVDYLIATKKLATRRIGTRVMIPVEEIRRFARSDHPERMAG